MKTFERDGETVFLPTNEERNAFQNQVVRRIKDGTPIVLALRDNDPLYKLLDNASDFGIDLFTFDHSIYVIVPIYNLSAGNDTVYGFSAQRTTFEGAGTVIDVSIANIKQTLAGMKILIKQDYVVANPRMFPGLFYMRGAWRTLWTVNHVGKNTFYIDELDTHLPFESIEHVTAKTDKDVERYNIRHVFYDLTDEECTKQDLIDEIVVIIEGDLYQYVANNK